ncbi:MAG: 4Fe-4S dicluster domain-containing protein [Ruminococcaceae bacterium]|nr:4Fe-4S dicluster domain-containing protein [Oscillospiraceae bacterium]
MSIHFKINNIEVEAEAGELLINVAKRYGVDIPSLCHNEKVKSYGACGVCVVESAKGGKLMRSCSTEVGPQFEGMEICTESDRVVRARKVALELLMTDHTGDCRPPCMLECPAHTDCQGYVGLIANGYAEEAVKLIMEKIPLPASIGRVCPHPCEKACRRAALEEPVSIANLKRFAADVNLEKGKDAYKPAIAAETGKKVAVIGGGPAGLTAAASLRAKGHTVEVFDMMPEMGGMLRYGIPEYRLPKAVVAEEVALLESMGIAMHNNIKIGEGEYTLEKMSAEYDAVIVAIGAWTSSKMRIPGEELAGVMGGIDFLREINLGNIPNIGKKVVIVGGGNTAMDACRSAVRAGADEVYTLYRRTRAEMPAEQVEIDEAEEEGVIFKFLCNPVEIIGENGKAVKVKAQKMMLGEPDASGRRAPVPIEGEFDIIDVDTVIMAIGQGCNVKGFESLELTRKNTVVADENTYTTSIEGVFACGDITNRGPGIAIAAIAEAQKAAVAAHEYMMSGSVPTIVKNEDNAFYSKRPLTKEDVKEEYAFRGTEERVPMKHRLAEERKGDFNEFMKGFSRAEAEKEAARCLECGCLDYYECRLIDYANRYDVKPERIGGYKHKRADMKVRSEYFTRDTDKCILCGLCVRACEEVTGRGVLGLVDRGFDTTVQPAMGLPLNQADCMSCGLCVSVCPTGALTENMNGMKAVPLPENMFVHKCTMCSAGCDMMISHYGNAITKAVPMGGKNADVLCERGRFVLPERFTMGNAMEAVQKAFGKILKSGAMSAGKIGVLISASCTEKQVNNILSFTAAIMPAFVASNSMGKPIPEKYRASVEFAAIKNGKATSIDELTIGVNDEILKKAGVTMLNEQQKAKIESGEIETLFVFGDDICDIDTSKVKNTEIVRIEF